MKKKKKIQELGDWVHFLGSVQMANNMMPKWGKCPLSSPTFFNPFIETLMKTYLPPSLNLPQGRFQQSFYCLKVVTPFFFFATFHNQTIYSLWSSSYVLISIVKYTKINQKHTSSTHFGQQMLI